MKWNITDRCSRKEKKTNNKIGQPNIIIASAKFLFLLAL